jgi:hypothetical protein
MDDSERFRLLGKYQTPRFRIGQTVCCQVRGKVIITGITDALIPWPMGKPNRWGGWSMRYEKAPRFREAIGSPGADELDKDA